MARYLLRVRSFTRPARSYDWGGWRNCTRWTPWHTESSFDTYAEAEAAQAAFPKTGLRRAAVFYRGKPYREERNAQGQLLRITTGADAW